MGISVHGIASGYISIAGILVIVITALNIVNGIIAVVACSHRVYFINGHRQSMIHEIRLSCSSVHCHLLR